MKYLNALFLFLCFNISASLAQDVSITCTSERNADNSISVYADSRCYGEYTLKLTFTSLLGYSTTANLHSGVALATVTSGRKEIMKLTPDKSAQTYSLQYRYQYFPGKSMYRVPDSSFVYLMPSNAGNHLKISKVSSLSERFGTKQTDNFYGTGFIYQPDDTICAARAGTIYYCDNKVKEGEDATTYFRSGRNRIGIQHKDGTLGDYTMLAPIQLLVSAGEDVYPGQPLAVFNKKSEKYIVLFSTYYLDEKK